ncbi:hypothetical protein F4703DRAFT_1761349, partial [Phycomyces blakesleeanus]
MMRKTLKAFPRKSKRQIDIAFLFFWAASISYGVRSINAHHTLLARFSDLIKCLVYNFVRYKSYFGSQPS